MVASTTGAKGSTSKHDREAGARRARVAQALVTQGGIALILLGLAWFQRGDRQASVLYLATLLVPIGWAWGIWQANTREDAARRAGTWSKEMARAEQKRTLGILGALVVAWVAIALAIVWLL